MSCDEIMMQDVNNLFKIYTLQTVQEDIERIINKGQGSADQVIVKKKVYDQTWYEFVCAHEQYFEAEVGVEEKERASRRYKELMEKRYIWMKLWKVGVKGQSQVISRIKIEA